MMSAATIEGDIAATRARLDQTIDRIQEKLTLTGLVDEALSQAGAPRYASGPDFLLALLRRHPVPVMIAAAGLGWMMYRSKRARIVEADAIEDANYVEVAATNDGQSRIYDPDRPSRHPSANLIEPGRVLESQA